MNSAAEFLATGKKFQLGFLETEKPNPKTVHLSDIVKNDLEKAIEILVGVDVDALEKLKLKIPEILNLRKEIQATFKNGGRVFLCGCGATGRLSMTLESLYREQNPGREDVTAFMAGGDVALVHSLEGFEDFPEYGERHLRELGFGEKDLLISPTEGGETPYVIGATEAAAQISKVKPYFLYCNPDELLVQNVERSRRVLENSGIHKINLCVGNMSLTGSTRMQASTVLQLAIGFALLSEDSAEKLKETLTVMQSYLQENAVSFLVPFIKLESGEYLESRYILYCVRDYAITVFTDTTERAPTFSLTPFSHKGATKLLKLKPSRCYIAIPNVKSPRDAWQSLLGRAPRALNWSEVDARTNDEYMQGFDFSDGAREFRKSLTNNAEHSDFEIFRHENSLLWRLQDVEMRLLWPAESTALFEHTVLKMLLNTHSTLVMGLLDRYKSNLMTWVYPTNGKLIDRASRYVQTLLKEDGCEVSYEKVVEKIFELKTAVTDNDSIVLAAYESLRK
ncbi:MAG: hypothetical protein KDD38_08775 [Bdellovibrionales bacterium]|nr:hypothetical protein [Bdellovibrionales bacterium]